jgi:hypothetical protein
MSIRGHALPALKFKTDNIAEKMQKWSPYGVQNSNKAQVTAVILV